MKGRPLDDWKQRQRAGMPSITRKMYNVLAFLKQAKDADYPFVPLPPGIDARTIRALCELSRGWVFASPGLDGVRYTITGAGEKALKVYTPTVKRGDGICPRCGERPRRVRKQGANIGTPAPYCAACENRMARRKYRLGVDRLLPDRLCSRCRKRPRYVASTGRVYTYCRHCKNVLHRRRHRRERKFLLKRALAGEHIPCRRENCDEPRYVSGKTVQDYCYRHFREYMTAYNDRRRPESKAAQSR